MRGFEQEGIDRGVHAVFDGVGKDTFDMDFDLVRRCALLLSPLIKWHL